MIINFTFSLPPGSSNPRKCSNTWSSSCDSSSLNDAFNSSWNGTHDLGCSGVRGIGSDQSVQEVYLNATLVKPGDAIEATCQFYTSIYAGFNCTESMFYYNGSVGGWMKLANWSSNDSSLTVKNRTVVFIPNNTEGTHYIRCSLRFNYTPKNFCANFSAVESDWGVRDNDDVDFNVTLYPKYSSWNINVATYTVVNRSDSILAYAQWNKDISHAILRHNGTGSFENYTISSLYEGNWTNYTLDISNTTEFSKIGLIEISYIWANDTYGLENYTSTPRYFNITSGIPPNVTNFWFETSQPTDKVNKHAAITIYANVSDDVGISNVTANITYPNSNSINLSMIFNSAYNEWETWKYEFGDDFLNTTGNYTLRITAYDLGYQTKTGGVDTCFNVNYGCPDNGMTPENVTLIVSDNYTLNITDGKFIYMRGENVTLEAKNVFNEGVTDANWIVNVTKIYDVFNFTSQQTIFNYTILPDDPEGNYSIVANASLKNNSGNFTWQFNVSNDFTILMSVEQTTPSTSSSLNLNASLYNARGELYTSSINANISCENSVGVYRTLPLIFSLGQVSSTLCYASSSPSTTFNITINVSDEYNNSGLNYTLLTTAAAVITYIPSSGGGGGGGFAPSKKEDKCSDGTLYGNCSVNKPLFCRNGTLVEYCSICSCKLGLSCQPDGTCLVIREEDFNFTVDETDTNIVQGGDRIVGGHLKNTGETVLNLISFLNTTENCLNVSLPSSFELKENEEKDFEIRMHVPLIIEPQLCLVKIGIGTYAVKKERTIYVSVEESLDILTLSEIKTQIDILEKEIQDYKAAGVDTRNLEALVTQSKILVESANQSVTSDQLTTLKNALSELGNNLNSASSRLTTLRTQKFLFQNSWLIGLLIVMSLTTMYMVPQVLLPLNKKDKDLAKLKEEEQALILSRVETEKQYFMRKIDSNTFSKIMIEKQDKILKTKGMIQELEKERSEIIKSVSPLAMLRWFGRGIKSIPVHIKNIPKRLLKKKINIDKDGKAE